jgi:catechol 2,3-dioxygenase-like lactoylglutathione lyase family enzyme
MKRVTGIGGVFFKSQDPAALRSWYREHLGVESEEWGAVFPWREQDRPERSGHTVWAPFPADSDYFPGPLMVNYRVDDLDAVLSALRAEGVEVDDRVEESEFGRFGWIVDPDGRRVELWQPPESAPSAD